MGINHSFREAPDGVDETCVVPSFPFFFLAQITEGYLVVVMTAEQRRQGGILSITDGTLTTPADTFVLEDDNEVGVGCGVITGADVKDDLTGAEIRLFVCRY